MRLCAAQFEPVAGDVPTNMARHLALIEHAAAHRGDVVVFPELSLTGYEPRLAAALAGHAEDSRLDAFQQASDAYGMTIGVGLPIAIGSGVQIGTVWFSPDLPRRVYAKQWLHADERPYFVPGNDQLLLEAGGLRLAPAICFESLQVEHADTAAALGARVYLASVAKPAFNVARAMAHYPVIARRHRMCVLMANCVGPSDNFVSAGQTAAWNDDGALVAQMDGESAGIVLFDTDRREPAVHTLEDRP